jgi:hypothetical protein
MTHLYVKIISNCIHSFYEEREWGSWEETWENHLDGISLDKDRFYYPESVPTDFEVAKGDIVYVVWAEYSGGNSFGSGDRNYTDVIHIFKDQDLAWNAHRILESPVGEEYKNWTIKFKSDSGKEISYCRPWLGYFESLDDVHVVQAIVE